MMGNKDKYDELIAAAAAEYVAAAAAAKEASGEAAAARGELAQLEAELATLRDELRAFERNELLLGVEEYHARSDRARWLEVRTKGQRGVAEAAGRRAQLAGLEVSSVGGKWRGKLRTLVAEDIKAFEEEKRAALEAVLKG